MNCLFRLLLPLSSVKEKVIDPEEDKSVFQKLKNTICRRIYILNWLPHYSKGDIVADFIAGLTVGMTMIPQSVAYAGLAGLPPQYGLYTAFIGSFTYIFFGSVKEVSIGPTSLMALLTFSYGVGRPIECIVLLTFLAGCIELLMGLFNLGFLIDFISPCLTSGFTSATSIVILVSQAKNFFGVKIKSHDTFPAIKELIRNAADIRVADTSLGVICIIFLLCFKQLTKIRTKSEATKKLLWFLSISKNALVVFISTIIASIWYNQNGGTPFKLTGPVPSGLPEIGLPPTYAEFNNSTMTLVDMVKSLGSGIIVIPVVAVLANVAIAKAYSAETVVDASQEMMALGLSNILGSFVKAFPSCGAFTRSAVASSSNVRTPLQGAYAGTVIILALSFLAPYFFYIPKSTLAAVLIVAACSLVDYEILITLWKCNKVDFFMTLMTFFVGVLYSVEMSIVIGAIFNAFVLLKAWSRPYIFVEIKMTEKSLSYIYIRPDLGLFYPAADYLTETIKKAHKKNPYIPIALDCSGILNIDYSAAKTIDTLIRTYNQKHTGIVLLNVKESVMKRLATITESSNLKVCQSTEDIHSKSFGNRDIENPDDVPLLQYNMNLERRYSEKREDVRKGSLCDLE